MKPPIGLTVALALESAPRLVGVVQRARPARVDRMLDERELALGLGDDGSRVRDALLELALEVLQHVVGLFGQDRGKDLRRFPTRPQ